MSCVCVSVHLLFTMSGCVLQTNNVVPEDKEGSDEPTTEVHVMSCVCQCALHFYFTVAALALHNNFICWQHHMHFTYTSLLPHQLHTFTCTSLLLRSLHNITCTFTCISLLLHSTSQQLHHYFTAALHHMHFSCISLLLHSTSKQLAVIL